MRYPLNPCLLLALTGPIRRFDRSPLMGVKRRDGAGAFGLLMTHKRHAANCSLDHLVGEREQLVRHVEAERLGGTEVEHEFEFGGSYDW